MVAALLCAALLAAVPLVPASAAAPVAVPPVAVAGGGTEQERLQQLLDTTVGPGKAVVMVNARVNRNRSTSAQLSYSNRGTPLSYGSTTQTASGAMIRARSSQLAVGQTVTQTHFASGATQRQSVALLIDSAVPRATVRALRKTVTTAASLNRRRGDRLSVVRMPFTKKPAAPSSPPLAVVSALSPGGRAQTVRWAGMGLAGLVFLVALVRALTRAEDAPIKTD